MRTAGISETKKRFDMRTVGITSALCSTTKKCSNLTHQNAQRKLVDVFLLAFRYYGRSYAHCQLIPQSMLETYLRMSVAMTRAALTVCWCCSKCYNIAKLADHCCSVHSLLHFLKQSQSSANNIPHEYTHLCTETCKHAPTPNARNNFVPFSHRLDMPNKTAPETGRSLLHF